MVADPLPLAVSATEASRETPLLRAHMPELDSVRGVAILMVVFYHALYWGIGLSGFPPLERRLLQAAWVGRLGVNLFFVLSGFLITGLLLNSRGRPDYYRKFYIRRALRIFPAYFATLLVLLLAGVSIKFAGLSLLYLSNLTPLFGVAIAYPVLWSLAVEEHFYLLWPLTVRNLSSRVILAGAGVIILLSPLFRWVSFQSASRQGGVSFEIFDYTWNSADGLACGAFLAVWLREFSPDRKKLRRLVVALFAVGLALLPFGILSRQTAPGAALQVVPWHFLFAAAIGAALLAGSRRGAPVRWRLLEFFGGISYGLYLYHLLVFRGFDWLVKRGARDGLLQIDSFLELILRFVICGGIAVGVAYLSHRYFEEPFLRLKSRLAP